jgi:hypothetical protein
VDSLAVSKESGLKGPKLRVSGVGCQVSGKKNKKLKTETSFAGKAIEL